MDFLRNQTMMNILGNQIGATTEAKKKSPFDPQKKSIPHSIFGKIHPHLISEKIHAKPLRKTK